MTHLGPDFSQLTDYEGSAEDIPELIESWVKGPKTARLRIATQLAERLNQIGASSPATAPAVSLMVAALARYNKPDAASLVVLLGELAAMGDHVQLITGGRQRLHAEVASAHPDDPRLPSRDAVQAHEPQLVQLLGARAAPVRAAAAFVLAFIDTETSCRALIEQRTVEKDAVVQASLELALTYHECTAETPKSDMPMAQVARSLRMLMLTTLPATAEALLDTLALAEQEPTVVGLPWIQGDLKAIATQIVVTIACRDGHIELLKQLIDDMAAPIATPATNLDDWLRIGSPQDEMHQQTTANIVNALTDAVFQHRDRRIVPHDLSNQEREVLQLLTTTRNTFAAYTAQRPLAERGISGQRGICSLLAKSASLPFDEEFRGEPRWRILNEVISGARPETDWEAAVATLSPDERVDLALDGLDLPHQLHLPWPRRAQPNAATSSASFYARMRALVDSTHIDTTQDATVSKGRESIITLLGEQRLARWARAQIQNGSPGRAARLLGHLDDDALCRDVILALASHAMDGEDIVMGFNTLPLSSLPTILDAANRADDAFRDYFRVSALLCAARALARGEALEPPVVRQVFQFDLDSSLWGRSRTSVEHALRHLPDEDKQDVLRAGLRTGRPWSFADAFQWVVKMCPSRALLQEAMQCLLGIELTLDSRSALTIGLSLPSLDKAELEIHARWLLQNGSGWRIDWILAQPLGGVTALDAMKREVGLG